MKLWSKLGGFPKTLVVLVTILLIATGICGVDQIIEARHGWGFMTYWGNSPTADLIETLDFVGLVLILLSTIGIVMTSLAWLIRNGFRMAKNRSMRR